jgi:hypothetical protein
MKTVLLLLFPLFSFTQVEKTVIPKKVSSVGNVSVYQADSVYTISFVDMKYMYTRNLHNITFTGRQYLTDLLNTVSEMDVKDNPQEAYTVILGREKVLVAWIGKKIALMCADGSYFTLNAKLARRLNDF